MEPLGWRPMIISIRRLNVTRQVAKHLTITQISKKRTVPSLMMSIVMSTSISLMVLMSDWGWGGLGMSASSQAPHKRKQINM